MIIYSLDLSSTALWGTKLKKVEHCHFSWKLIRVDIKIFFNFFEPYPKGQDRRDCTCEKRAHTKEKRVAYPGIELWALG